MAVIPRTSKTPEPPALSSGGDRPPVTESVDPKIIDRVKAEFQEMRGFSPTLSQAARLFHLPRRECARVLELLASEDFLRREDDGTYRLLV